MTTDPSVRPGAQGAIAAIAVTFLVVGVVAVVIHYRQPASNVDLSLDTWRPSAEDWNKHREQEELLALKVELGSEEKKVLAAFADLNRTELLVLDKEPDESLRQAMTVLEMVAERYFLKHGAQKYRALGVFAAKQFADVLTKLLAATRQKGVKATEIAKVFAGDPLYQQWQDIGGDFLSNALRSGLLSPQGDLQPGAEIIVPLLFASRWSYFVRNLGPKEAVETPFARLTLLKWKVEYHHGLTMERRHELIREVLELQPNYPVDDVLGRLYAKYSDWRRSAEHFEKALRQNPTNLTLQANLEYAKSRLGRQ